jgi:hypothetical protein
MYKLTWGFHRGTTLSRDDGEPYTFETEAEALAKIEDLKKDMARLGRYVWFADINGKRVFYTPYSG